MAMTVEQQRALAMARARMRQAQNSAPAQPAAEPSGPVPVPSILSDPEGYLRATLQNRGMSEEQINQTMKGAKQSSSLGNVNTNPIRDLADTARVSANDALFGLPDYAVGTLTGDRQAQRELTEQARERAGPFATGAGVAAGLAVPFAAVNRGATLLGRFGSEGLRGVSGLLARGGLGAAEGAAYGGLNAAGREQDIGQGLATGAALGGIASSAAPLIARAISPNQIAPERQAAVDILQSEGIPLTAAQQTGSRRLGFLESELGGSAYQNAMDEQARAFSEAAAQRAGIQGTLTPENMAENYARLGQGFQDISSRNALAADDVFNNQIGSVLQEYNRVLPTAQREVVNNLADDIMTSVSQNGGSMPGEVYQATRSRLGRMAQSARNSDPEYAGALRGLRNTLDDAMARSIPPEDAVAWGELRRQYGNNKVLEKAARNIGEAGTITPSQLRTAAIAGRPGQYARNEGDFDALARAGSNVMTPLPNSGTAARINVRNLGSNLLTGLGGAFGGIPGAIAGYAAPRIAGRALMSTPVQQYLMNQTANSLSPQTRSIIQNYLIGSGLLSRPPNTEGY